MKNTKYFLSILLILILAFVFLGCDLLGDDGSSGTTVSNATLVVVNNSSYDIYYLYVSLSTLSSWGNNQMTSVLYPGYTYTLNEIPPGEYDLWAEDNSGTYWERYYENLTDGETWTWTLID